MIIISFVKPTKALNITHVITGGGTLSLSNAANNVHYYMKPLPKKLCHGYLFLLKFTCSPTDYTVMLEKYTKI